MNRNSIRNYISLLPVCHRGRLEVHGPGGEEAVPVGLVEVAPVGEEGRRQEHVPNQGRHLTVTEI